MNDPSWGEYFSLPFLPLSPSWTIVGLFELTRRPSRAPDSPRALLLEIQRNKDTVEAHRGLRTTASRTTDANLDCAFVKNALGFVAPKIGPPA